MDNDLVLIQGSSSDSLLVDYFGAQMARLPLGDESQPEFSTSGADPKGRMMRD